MEELCMRRLLEITTGAFGIIVPDTSLMNIKEGVSHRRMFMLSLIHISEPTRPY